MQNMKYRIMDTRPVCSGEKFILTCTSCFPWAILPHLKTLLILACWFDYEAVIKTPLLLLGYLSVKRPAVEKNILLCVSPFV